MKVIVTIFNRQITSVSNQEESLTIMNGGETRVEFGEKKDVIALISNLVDNIEVLENFDRIYKKDEDVEL